MDQTDGRERPRVLWGLWERLRRWGREREHLTNPPDERARQEVAHEARVRRETDDAAAERA